MIHKVVSCMLLSMLFVGSAMAASFDFTLASSEVVDLSTPLTVDVPTVIWTSSEVSQGTSHPSVRLFVRYEAFAPDTANVAPFNFELIAVLEQEQQDGSWEEIGRQNTPIRKLSQGAVREILVTPTAEVEEGVDQVIAGFSGVPVKLKSIFKDDSQGSLRVRMFALDGDPSGPNPFDGVTFSVNGQRYDG